MSKITRRTLRGEASLSRERIIEAAIALLDDGGETGLTFRALSERLGTGAGAIYWHIADKEDLLDAACDAVVADTLRAAAGGPTPQDALRATGLGLFDAIDAHPWVGAQLARAPSRMPMVRILESIGREVHAMGLADAALWRGASSLLHYILGVAGQNAANRQFARAHKLVREDFLGGVADQWAGLDAAAYPMTRAMAAQLRGHDDRADFLGGIDLILDGIAARQGRGG
jgi:AcrR family transcriptional regulator